MKYVNQSFEGERSLFAIKEAEIIDCHFLFGESPLKESCDISIVNTSFDWKYPLWYASNIDCSSITLTNNARSGIWYTHNIKITDSLIEAPKTFRRANDIYLKNVNMPNASETLWNCKDIKIINCSINGDYLLMNSKDVKIDHLRLVGNYFLDGGSDIVISNSILESKDAFWNCKNVVVKDCIIHGEYLGWNSENVTFINCEIISHQGLCYMKNVKLINCKLIDSDLCFEYSSDIKAQIISEVDSIKNPYSGTIKVKGVKQLILDEKYIDIDKVKVVIKNEI